MTTTNANEPMDRVLATLNADGSRRWRKPWLSKGAFWKWRRVVAYGLIALFVALPYIPINGKPAVLLDLPGREFTLFGFTFLPTDTALMAVLMLTIFLVTALFGRVWCGWACPQTVYMEFLFRPVERLFEGDPKRRRSEPVAPWRKVAKWGVYLAACMFLTHVFLAYFIGVEALSQWVTQSPLEHPVPFMIMVAVTGLMMFDFCFFREQTCLVACPYGRLQAAMLDKHSLIVTYDESRGEPRGVKKRKRLKKAGSPMPDVSLRVMPEGMGAADGAAVADAPEGAATHAEGKDCSCGGSCKTGKGSCSHAAPAPEPAVGDCVDCKKCVTTCPTGIDIRDGLQLECIGCAQCIDACNEVMLKLGREPGLIRYSSRAILDGAAKSIIRPRTILYPAIVLGLCGLWLFLFLTRQDAEVRVLPRQGATHYTLPSGDVSNQVRLRVVNRAGEPRSFVFDVAVADAASGVMPALLFDRDALEVAPSEPKEVGFQVSVPPDSFSNRGRLPIIITVSSTDSTFTKDVEYTMFGPASSTRRRAAEQGEADEGSNP